MPLADSLALPDAHASADALTDLLQVRLDGSWVLSEQALTQLVDAVGGIDADVDVDLSAPDANGRTVQLGSGRQHLDGRSAAALVAYRAPEEADQVRLARFKSVLVGLIGALPADSAARAGVLAGVGPGSSTTLSAGAFGRVVGTLRRAVAGDDAAYETLPVSVIDTGADEPSAGLDTAQAPALVQRLLGSSGATGARPSVLVQNGVGVPGLVGTARSRLLTGSFRFIDGGNAASFGVATSVVLVGDATAPTVEQGRKVAAALRLPATAVRLAPQPQGTADVIAILGADFTP